jgi:hypothetical protein
MLRKQALSIVLGFSATAGAVTASPPTFNIDSYTIDSGGGTATGSTYELQGTIGQPDAGMKTGGMLELSGGFWFNAITDVVSCVGTSDCADLDGNNVRDDNCVWWDCSDTLCEATPLAQFADMGGAFGACRPEGAANIHDRNHALRCFSGTNPCDSINIDAGGAFGACAQDGVCDIHDANHALSVFAGNTTCSCPSGPMPELSHEVWGDATLRLAAHRANRDGMIEVDAFIDGPVDALRSYQLDVSVTGGRAGTLELVDIRIDERRHAVFSATDAFDAFNVSNGQVLAGLNADDGISIRDSGYLATFVYKATKDADGKFVIDIAVGEEGQTFLVAPEDGVIEVEKTNPAVISLR